MKEVLRSVNACARQVKSHWCKDVVSPMVKLLSEALQDSSEKDKFAFMSHQTLPVKPFQEVYQALLQRETSDFCTFEPKRWRLHKSSGKFHVHVRAHQWSVLTAKHARAAVSAWPNSTIAKDFGGCAPSEERANESILESIYVYMFNLFSMI